MKAKKVNTAPTKVFTPEPSTREPIGQGIVLNRGAMEMAKQSTMRDHTPIVVEGQTNFDPTDLTASQTRAFFQLMKRMPKTDPKFITYQKDLKNNMKDKGIFGQGEKDLAHGSIFADPATTVTFNLADYARDTYGDKWKDPHYKKLLVSDLEYLSQKPADSLLNATIGDTTYFKEHTGRLFYYSIDQRGKLGKRNQKLIRDATITVTYHDALVYSPSFGYSAKVPENIGALLLEYDSNKAIFARLFWEFVDIRGKQTSRKWKGQRWGAKKKQIKETRGRVSHDEWVQAMFDTFDEQCTRVYTQNEIKNMLKPAERGTYWVNDTKRNRVKFHADRFQADLTNAISSFVAMGLLKAGRVFDCSDEGIDEICKTFPTKAETIRKVEKHHGICIVVQFNEEWNGQTPQMAVEVKE